MSDVAPSARADAAARRKAKVLSRGQDRLARITGDAPPDNSSGAPEPTADAVGGSEESGATQQVVEPALAVTEDTTVEAAPIAESVGETAQQERPDAGKAQQSAIRKAGGEAMLRAASLQKVDQVPTEKVTWRDSLEQSL
eukprot:CAMPEP_0177751844 /NCGR_PEP_ID=MMETSP0491_2-20121128/600_1 /TAXON_ID=63592 /ORGANISM="Tetraselmis chuii, Strain PLY429" /LENGTH=139 /DNA_ID=CAMNT_0019267003 /DNA_START=132 /DNA_END=547 /DNA_ORIENTATION=-